MRPSTATLVIALIYSIWAHPAYGHDPQHQSDWIGEHGYKKPGTTMVCCGPGDCGVLDDGAVRETPQGFVIHGYRTLFGENGTEREFIDDVVPMNRTQISEDQHFWYCSQVFRGPDGHPTTDATPRERYCFFAPNRAY